VIGHVVIGPARGEAFRVCVDKKGCPVHWSDYQRAAKRREREVSKAAGTGEDREKLRRQKEQEEEARRQAERERFEKAKPAIIAALVAALKKAPAGAGGPLGKLVLDAYRDGVAYNAPKEAAKYLPPGKSAEDLVRHMGLAVFLSDLDYTHVDVNHLAAQAKPFGVDIVKVIAAAAPAEPKAATTKKAAKKKR
jgi:hypothetical protein